MDRDPAAVGRRLSGDVAARGRRVFGEVVALGGRLPGIIVPVGRRMSGVIALSALAALVSACGSTSGQTAGSAAGQAAGSTARAAEAAAARQAARLCQPPYSASSPWNTPIGPHPTYDPNGPRLLQSIGPPLSSDPTEFTFPVYYASDGTPRTSVRVAGHYSEVSGGGATLTIVDGVSLSLPLPPNISPAAGNDAQLIVVDPSTGDEWGFWQLARDGSGSWTAENGYHYNTRWSGVPPSDPAGRPFGSRGSGVPYLAGLIRPCEIERGRIDHALAFAYHWPSPAHVPPATKSDGLGDAATSVPEGARLQLDPSLTTRQLKSQGCRGPCLIIARAMQTYGMYVIDNSGRAKLMAEYEGTAHWNGLIAADTVSSIPVSALRLIALSR
jgi:hypothetical protein